MGCLASTFIQNVCFVANIEKKSGYFKKDKNTLKDTKMVGNFNY